MHYQAIRNTLFAYLSALEEDLRDIVQEQVAPQYDGANYLSEQRIIELKRDGVDMNSTAEILLSLDFAEPWELISGNQSFVDKDIYTFISKHIKALEKYVILRNTVVHSRPLDPDFLSQIIKLVEDIQNTNPANFQSVKKTHRNIKLDPSAAIEMPMVFDRSADRMHHNLPVPDFDETGLIGREKELADLESHIKGPYPVITLVGEGAIGKTALAVRLGYKVLDDPSYDFDTIIWVSAKANKLLPNEIATLNNEIKNSIDLLRTVSEFLGAFTDDKSGFDELLTYLNEFKIFLIIDNLETIIDQNLITFLSNIRSRDSKIFLTSRVGIGQFEFPYALKPLNERDSVSLLRALANVRRVEHLTKCSNQKLLGYSAKLLHSPGFIKWYVSLVQMGSSPEQALSTPKLFLEFALENVVTRLSEKARFVSQLLSINPLSKSLSEIAFLTDINGDELRKAVMELCAANIVSLSTNHNATVPTSSYQISDLARAYITNKFPLQDDLKLQARKKVSEIAFLRDKAAAQVAEQGERRYALNSINHRSTDDAVVGKILKQAHSFSYDKRVDEALGLIEGAKTLAPDFSEVYRVAAQIYYFSGNFSLAEENYETALELAKDDPALLYFFAGFKLRGLNETNQAAELLQKARTLDPDSQSVAIELSRALTYLEQFTESLNLLLPIISDKHAPLKTVRVATDGLVQNYTRNLQKTLNLGKGFDSVKIFMDATSKFLELESRCFDSRVLKNLHEFRALSNRIHDIVFDSSQLDRYSQTSSDLDDFLDTKIDEDFNHLEPQTTNFLDASDESEIAAKSYRGPCIAANRSRGFGFVYSHDYSQEFYFKIKGLEAVRIGMELEFKIIKLNDRFSAEIINTLEKTYAKNPETVSIFGVSEGLIQLLFFDKTMVRIPMADLTILGVNPSKMVGEEIEIKSFSVPSKTVPIICDIKLSADQLKKFKMGESDDRLYTGTVRYIKISNHRPQRDTGAILVDDLSIEVWFKKNNMKRPFSFYGIKNGSNVRFNLEKINGVVSAKNIEPSDHDLPVIDDKPRSGFLRLPSPSSLYGFVVLDDKWDFLARKADFVNPDDWDTAENTMLTFILKGDNEQGFRATHIQKEENA
ncbi:hypothetical protein OAO72_06100 [Alphaproteobacteria bacterium]|nr:hypothetical protein [Alphaproteobacteria bacterium]